MNHIGKRLNAARKARGLTQDQLAAQMNVSRSTISHWENDQAEPDLDSLRRLSALLGENLLVRRRLRLRRNLRLPNLPLHQGSLPAVGICGRFLVVVSIGHARFSFVFAACLSARAQMRTHHMETW